jgi:hypothetical protein
MSAYANHTAPDQLPDDFDDLADDLDAYAEWSSALFQDEPASEYDLCASGMHVIGTCGCRREPPPF